MTKSARVLALAGLLTAGAAAPAMATWVPVTAVPLDSRPTIDVVDASRELPTRVEALSITAHDSDVMCSNVTGFFRDGQTMQLFHGILPAGRENVIHMMPVHRDIKRVDFHCQALNGPGTINVAANIAGHLIIVDHPAVVGAVVTTPPAVALAVPMTGEHDYMVAEDD